MFESFNVSHFLTIASIYLVFLVLSQVYLKSMIAGVSKILGVKPGRVFVLATAFTVFAIGAWVAAIYFYGISAAAVLVLGMAAEIAIGYVRRNAIQQAVLSNLAMQYQPLNFNEINGKTL